MSGVSLSLADGRVIFAALFGIGLSILLIVRGRIHPFVALLCGAFAVGLIGGLGVGATAKAVQKGAGDIFGGAGLVVALGLALGAMLQTSNGATGLARSVLRWSGQAGAPWASLLVSLVIGLPLFFETGLVLLMPIIAAGAATMAGDDRDALKLRMILPALSGLSVVHALVPPHPGPLLAVDALHADLGRTMLYGLAVAAPTAVVAGPLLSRFISRGVRLAPVILPAASGAAAPPVWRALTVVLLPVVLIAGGQLCALAPPSLAPRLGWLTGASNPVVALLIACLAAPPLLFGRGFSRREVQDAIWAEAMKPAGAVLLAIVAGGALKQVLVTAGLSDLLARVAAQGAMSPILLAWLVAVCVRLATGSATVATITSAGIMSAAIARSGASPEWAVLAIGAGSVFFSHVNDPGFWLVKTYLGTDLPGTFRTWSVLETVVSVMGLVLILAASRLF